jgi:uncharacterized protein (UPF0305 family)
MSKIGYLRNNHDNIIEDEKAKINNNYAMQNITSINLKQFEEKIRFISKNLPKEYLEKFMVSLLFSIQKSIENNNTDEFEQNLADWEFTAEIESSPNLKKEITDAIKEGPSVSSVSLNDTLKEIRK